MPLSVWICKISAQRRQTPTLRIRWHVFFSWLPTSACLMCWMALLFYVVQKWQMLWHLSDLVQCRKWNFWKEAAFLRTHFVVYLWHFFHPKKLLLIFEFDVSWGPAFPIQPECLEHAFFHFFHVIISLTAKRFVDGWRYCTGMLERFYHQNNFSCRGIPSWYFLLRPRLWFSKVWREEVGQLSPLSIQLCLLLWGATGFGQQAETTNSFCAGSPAAVTLQCLSVITGRGRIWSSGGEAKSLCLPLLNILFKCRPWSHFLTLLRPGKGLKYDHYSLKQLGRDMPFYSLGSVFFSHLLQLSREP